MNSNKYSIRLNCKCRAEFRERTVTTIWIAPWLEAEVASGLEVSPAPNIAICHSTELMWWVFKRNNICASVVEMEDLLINSQMINSSRPLGINLAIDLYNCQQAKSGKEIEQLWEPALKITRTYTMKANLEDNNLTLQRICIVQVSNLIIDRYLQEKEKQIKL